MTLSVVSKVDGEPCDATVEVLASALAEARAGRIKMVALAAVDHRGNGWHRRNPGSVPRRMLSRHPDRVEARVLTRADYPQTPVLTRRSAPKTRGDARSAVIHQARP